MPNLYQPEVNREALAALSLTDLKTLQNHLKENELHDFQYEDEIRVLDKEIDRRLKNIFIH